MLTFAYLLVLALSIQIPRLACLPTTNSVFEDGEPWENGKDFQGDEVLNEAQKAFEEGKADTDGVNVGPQPDKNKFAKDLKRICKESQGSGIVDPDETADETYPADTETADKTYLADMDRSWVQNSKYRWPGGVVPIIMDIGITFQDRRAITNSLDDIKNKSGGCVSFVKKKCRDNFKNWIRIKSKRDGDCDSRVGRIYFEPGEQVVNLPAKKQSTCMTRAVIQHEAFHALGVYHEQSRPDRDKYIRVNKENVKNYDIIQFTKEKEAVGDDLVPYNIHSVMQYDNKAFSKNGKFTITARNGEGLSQDQEITQGDMITLVAMYGNENPIKCKVSNVAPKSEFADVTCSDWHNNCDQLANDKTCKDDSKVDGKLISKLCRQTCGTCDLYKCKDKDLDCGQKIKDCTEGDPKTTQWMETNCPAACGLC